jgi:hypothetical protein
VCHTISPVEAWRTMPWSRWLSWRIPLLVGRRGASCARTGTALRVVAQRALVRPPPAGRLEGAVDGRPYEAQWLAWRCPVAACSTTSGMVVQWPGWRRSDGDGCTGPMATEVTAPTGLTSRRRPMGARSSCASSLRGFRRPFLRVRCAGHAGVGGTVSRGGY